MTGSFVVSRLGGLFFVSSGPNTIGIMIEDETKAHEACARMNAFIALDRRKNAALDWALANNVPDEELHAAINDNESMGLLAFESRMADLPVVVGE